MSTPFFYDLFHFVFTIQTFLQCRHLVICSNSSSLLLLHGISSYENTTIDLLIPPAYIWIVSAFGAAIRSLCMSLGNSVYIYLDIHPPVELFHHRVCVHSALVDTARDFSTNDFNSLYYQYQCV